jgi:hypothetical protein
MFEDPNISRQILSLIPEGCFIGTSLILPERGRFLFGIREPKVQAGGQVLEITGIGGGLEAHDQTITHGVQREAREEICTEVRLISSHDTLVVRSRHELQRINSGVGIGPVALVFRRYRTPAHDPWARTNQGQAALLVFQATTLLSPAPCGELHGLIWLSAAQILKTANQDVVLHDLLDGGAELTLREGNVFSKQAKARMTDSQEALAIALGQETLSFYSALMR